MGSTTLDFTARRKSARKARRPWFWPFRRPCRSIRSNPPLRCCQDEPCVLLIASTGAPSRPAAGCHRCSPRCCSRPDRVAGRAAGAGPGGGRVPW